MFKVFVLSKRQIQLIIAVAVLMLLTGIYLSWNQSRAASAQPAEARVIEMVTGEFKSTTKDGDEIEAYVWHPGTIIVSKGELIELRISGVNGSSHPFVIEKLGLTGMVEKGKTTTVRFTASKTGTYPIVCTSHTDMTNGGPMVGYIIVQ